MQGILFCRKSSYEKLDRYIVGTGVLDGPNYKHNGLLQISFFIRTVEDAGPYNYK